MVDVDRFALHDGRLALRDLLRRLIELAVSVLSLVVFADDHVDVLGVLACLFLTGSVVLARFALLVVCCLADFEDRLRLACSCAGRHERFAGRRRSAV